MFLKWKQRRAGQGTEKGRRKMEELRRHRLRAEYNTALRQIDIFLSQAENNEVRISILEYAIKVVKQDLIGEGLSQIIYGKEAPEWRNAFVLPFQSGAAENIQIQLSNTDILVTPWKIDKLPKATRDLLYAPFDKNKGHYTATYYPEIDLAIIGNGMHHAAVASVGAGGVIDRCSVVRMTPAFEEVSTDGATWVNSVTGSITGVDDFRFALLYSLAKMRHNIKNSISIMCDARGVIDVS